MPVLALGIPGGTTGAIMMIVLTYHGICSGRACSSSGRSSSTAIYMQMLVCYLFMALLILPLARYMSRVVWIPTRFLVPLILSLVTVAAFSEREYVFDMGARAVLRRDRLHRAQDRIRGDGDPDRRAHGAAVRAIPPALAARRPGRLELLFSSTLGNVLWVMVVIALVLPWIRSRRREGVLARTAEAGYE